MERWMDLILKCERDWRIHKKICPSCKSHPQGGWVDECSIRLSISELALQACLISTGYVAEVSKATSILMHESW